MDLHVTFTPFSLSRQLLLVLSGFWTLITLGLPLGSLLGLLYTAVLNVLLTSFGLQLISMLMTLHDPAVEATFLVEKMLETSGYFVPRCRPTACY